MAIFTLWNICNPCQDTVFARSAGMDPSVRDKVVNTPGRSGHQRNESREENEPDKGSAPRYRPSNFGQIHVDDVTADCRSRIGSQPHE